MANDQKNQKTINTTTHQHTTKQQQNTAVHTQHNAIPISIELELELELKRPASFRLAA
jgi:hypothetical protein